MCKKVSVVIPTYGGAEFLVRCIDSVLSQTYKEIEIIVVDDNGVGTNKQVDTAEVIKKYSEDSRVKYICHEVNKNGSAARNTGVMASSGEYIALMDDDDVFYPEKLERQVNLLDSLADDYAVVYCACDIYYNGAKIGESRADKSGSLLFECLSHKIQIASTSMLIRKSAYQSIGGFDESFKRHQDWEFIARLASKYLIKADNFLGFKRILELRNNLNTPEIYQDRRLYYLKKMEPLILSLPPRQQEEVLVQNKIDVVIMYVKHKRYKDFLKEYRELSIGWRGVPCLINRFWKMVFRGRIRVDR